MKIIAITTVFLALFFTNSAISKENIEKTSQKQEKNTQKDEKQEEKPAENSEKTIKFHKPETEAERALDEILRVENGLIKNSKLKREDMFTKGFAQAAKKRANDILNSEECEKYQCESLDDFDSANIITCAQDVPSFGYEFYTSFKDDRTLIISAIWSYKDHYNDDEYYAKSIKNSIKSPYIMKKENGKWKIDGICCSNINCPTRST